MDSTIIVYFVLSFFILFLSGKLAYKLKLVDLPSKRKFHSKPTVYTGGIAISLILICAIKLFDVTNIELNLILSMAFLISVVGFIDDKYHLNVGGKLSLQVIPIFYLIVFENLILIHLGDYGYFKLNLGVFAVPFSLLSVLFLINAFNYFDGMDGTLSFTSISVLFILYYLTSNKSIELYLITIFVPICVFLLFNFATFKLTKIFLGDSGSLLIGFIISFTLIYLANQKNIPPILLAWSVSIFVFEFLSINLIRLSKRKKLFKAGLDHLHHVIFQKSNSVILTNFIICILNIIFFIIGIISFKFLNPLSSFVLFIIIFIIFYICRKKYCN